MDKDFDKMASMGEQSKAPEDVIFCKTLEQRYQMSQDAAEYHHRELERHSRIVETCSEAIGRLNQPVADETPAEFRNPVQGSGGVVG